MLTIILTYSDESLCLQRWINIINNVCAQTSNIYFIIVDDASTDAPAIAYTGLLDTVDNISLYRMRYMVGYNMYSCRNLAMSETKTTWNLLCNVTSVFSSDDIIALSKMVNDDKLDSNTTFDFINSDIEKNILLVTKDNFWRAGGYDTEWIGCRGGQVTMIERLMEVSTKETLPFEPSRIAPIPIDREDDRIDRIYCLPIYDVEGSKQLVRDTIQQRRKAEELPRHIVQWSQQL